MSNDVIEAEMVTTICDDSTLVDSKTTGEKENHLPCGGIREQTLGDSMAFLSDNFNRHINCEDSGPTSCDSNVHTNDNGSSSSNDVGTDVDDNDRHASPKNMGQICVDNNGDSNAPTGSNVKGITSGDNIEPISGVNNGHISGDNSGNISGYNASNNICGGAANMATHDADMRVNGVSADDEIKLSSNILEYKKCEDETDEKRESRSIVADSKATLNNLDSNKDCLKTSVIRLADNCSSCCSCSASSCSANSSSASGSNSNPYSSSNNNDSSSSSSNSGFGTGSSSNSSDCSGSVIANGNMTPSAAAAAVNNPSERAYNNNSVLTRPAGDQINDVLREAQLSVGVKNTDLENHSCVKSIDNKTIQDTNRAMSEIIVTTSADSKFVSRDQVKTGANNNRSNENVNESALAVVIKTEQENEDNSSVACKDHQEYSGAEQYRSNINTAKTDCYQCEKIGARERTQCDQCEKNSAKERSLCGYREMDSAAKELTHCDQCEKNNLKERTHCDPCEKDSSNEGSDLSSFTRTRQKDDAHGSASNLDVVPFRTIRAPSTECLAIRTADSGVEDHARCMDDVVSNVKKLLEACRGAAAKRATLNRLLEQLKGLQAGLEVGGVGDVDGDGNGYLGKTSCNDAGVNRALKNGVDELGTLTTETLLTKSM